MILAESSTKQDLWPALSFLHLQHSVFRRTSVPDAKFDLGKKRSGSVLTSGKQKTDLHVSKFPTATVTSERPEHFKESLASKLYLLTLCK